MTLCAPLFLAQTNESENSKFESGFPGCHGRLFFKAGKETILYLPVSLTYNFCHEMWVYIRTLALGPPMLGVSHATISTLCDLREVTLGL